MNEGTVSFLSLPHFPFFLFSFVFLCCIVIYDCPFWAPGVFILPFKYMNEQTDGRRGGESAIFPASRVDVQHSTYRCKMGFISTSNLYLWIVLE